MIFKPAGVPARQLEAVEIGLDELEALRLADLEGLYQDAAAERMGVSRPTFGRLIERARHKIASALMDSKMIVFKGGPVMARDERSFECKQCGTRFAVPHGTGRPEACPSCQSTEFHRADLRPELSPEESTTERGRGRCARTRMRNRGRRRAGMIFRLEPAPEESMRVMSETTDTTSEKETDE
jgi:uncharacterized protein